MRHALLPGAAGGGALAAWWLLSWAIGLHGLGHQHAALTSLAAAVDLPLSLAAVSWAIHRRRERDLAGAIRYGQAVATGSVAATVMAAVGAGFIAIYVTCINRGYLPHLLEQARARLVEDGQPAETVRSAMATLSDMHQPAAFVLLRFIGLLFTGALFAAMAAAFLRRASPPNPAPAAPPGA